MNKLSERKFQIWVAVGAAILSFILPIIWDVIKEKPITSTLGYFLKIISSVIGWIWVTIFEQSFKVWQIIVCFFLFIVGLGFIFNKRSNGKKISKNSWLDYNTDSISNLPFKWVWEKGSNGKYDISYLKPICKCGTSIPVSRTFKKDDFVTCPRCESIVFFPKSASDIITIIHDNVERGIYPI